MFNFMLKLQFDYILYFFTLLTKNYNIYYRGISYYYDIGGLYD